jgi:hypothetical protein
VFIRELENYDEDEAVVMITGKKFFDENGYVDDIYYRNEGDYDDGDPRYAKGIILELPYFLHECCESTYESSLSAKETVDKLLELGFEQRFM